MKSWFLGGGKVHTSTENFEEDIHPSIKGVRETNQFKE